MTNDIGQCTLYLTIGKMYRGLINGCSTKMDAGQFFTFASTVCKQMRDKWEKREIQEEGRERERERVLNSEICKTLN